MRPTRCAPPSGAGATCRNLWHWERTPIPTSPSRRATGSCAASSRCACDFQHPIGIATKGTLIERDLDLLRHLGDAGLVNVGVTVTTLDARLARALEPRVPSPRRRLATIRRLAEAGIPVRVMISPVIPGLTGHEIEQILKAASAAGARSASWAMLRLAPRGGGSLSRMVGGTSAGPGAARVDAGARSPWWARLRSCLGAPDEGAGTSSGPRSPVASRWPRAEQA